MLTTTTGAGLLTPEEVGTLLVAPIVTESIAANVSTVVTTEASSFRIPVVAADPSASWVAEGQEIPVTDADIDEAIVEFCKLAGLTIVTNELATDTSPQAAEAIGAGLARDMARKLDAAFFGSLPTPAPKGLAGLTGVSTVSAGAAFTSVDPFIEAIGAAEAVGATLTAFVANPADVLAMSKVKKATGSNEPLLGSDPTMPVRRIVQGVPLLSSPAVAAGTVWGIPQSRVFLVIRQDAEVEADASVFFTSDRTAVRGKLRCGFAFPHSAAVVKVSKSA